VTADVLLQRVVQNVRRSMGSADSSATIRVDAGRDFIANFDLALGDLAVVNKHVAVFLSIGNFEGTIGAGDGSGVANLTTGFRIERGFFKE